MPSTDISNPAASSRPSREEAETAVRTLLRWAGEDPSREGLLDTPRRVAEAVQLMHLKHVVITSVDRDDLTDGGADHFAQTIRAIRAACAGTVQRAK